MNLVPGVARQASHFLLLAQEKVTKEKGTPFAGPSGSPALLVSPGPLRNLRDPIARPRAQTVLATPPA